MLEQAFCNRIAVIDRVADWKEAIRLSVDPLIADGLAEPCYLDGIYQNIAQNGDYIIVAPGLAIPHARPETGAKGTGFSMLKLNQPVQFSSGEEIGLLVALVAVDAEAHLDMLSELTDLFIDDTIMKRIHQAKNTKELQEILR